MLGHQPKNWLFQVSPLGNADLAEVLSSVSVMAMPASPDDVAATEGLDYSAGVFYLFYDFGPLVYKGLTEGVIIVIVCVMMRAVRQTRMGQSLCTLF